MSGHAYYAVGMSGLWECNEDGAIVYGPAGQVKHDREHEARERLAAAVTAQAEHAQRLGATLDELRAAVGNIREHLDEVDDRVGRTL